MRRVTSALARIEPRGVEITTQSVLRTPSSAACSGEISQNNSGCNSASHGSQRLMAPRQVMLRQPIRGEDVRVLRRADRGVRVLLDVPGQHDRVVLLLRIDDVGHRRLVGLVVRRQRAVDQAVGHEQPALAVRLHDEGRGAVVRVEADAVRLGRRVGRPWSAGNRARPGRPTSCRPRPSRRSRGPAGRRTGQDRRASRASLAQGLPCGSAEQRLYRIRRLAGQAKPQPSDTQSSRLAVGRVVEPFGLLLRRREDAGVNPGTAGRRAVVLQVGERVDRLALDLSPARVDSR